MSQMSRTTIIRNVRATIDNKRVLDTLLRSLTSKRQVTPEDMDLILSLTIKKVADTVQAQAVTVFTVNKERTEIKFQNVYYAPSLYGEDEGKKFLFDMKAEQLQGVTMPMTQGIVGKVVETCQSYFVADAQADKKHYAKIDTDTGFVARSMITVPLKVGKQAIGAIQVLNKCIAGTVYQFAEEDVFLLEDVADYSAKIIQKCHYPETAFSDREMANYVARLAKCDYVEIDPDYALDTQLLKEIGKDQLLRYMILPLATLPSGGLRVCMGNPLDFQKIGDFELMCGKKIEEKLVAADSDVAAAIDRAFPKSTDLDNEIEAAREKLRLEIAQDEAQKAAETVEIDNNATEESAPVVALANRIVEQAYAEGASDIHIEPMETEVQVRYRIDGECLVKMLLPIQAHRALVSRYKIMSGMDIAERRIPQDGRIVYKKWTKKDIDVDLRVSTAPMNFGEKIVMRLLDKRKSALPLNKLGFSEYNLNRYREIIKAPYGMVLHCGPTGSGKSMTLFSALGEINDPTMNISTAEDPIEYTIKGINQMQMNRAAGLTFQVALRCFLRQDPDIILVGEIRDTETAEIAIEAALTGHLLFSTLHTNDAPSTIARFTEMEIEPFMISASLVCVCAQRLIRRVCSCAEDADPEPDEMKFLERSLDGKPIGKIKKIKGCRKCSGSGYKGRLGTHELLVPTDELRVAINRGKEAEYLRVVARMNSGMRTLFEDGMEKVKLGLTSLQEVIANIVPDEKAVGELSEKDLL
ncbi:MAG: ATPase, T2SS/T4P/T4SS family [Planctomycetota bacterium]